MDEREIEEILKSIPEDEPRSQLEPYRELILRLRRQGRPYQRILDIVNEKFGVQVAYATLYDFIQRRSRPRNEEPAAVTPAPAETPAAQPSTDQPRRRFTQEQIEEMRRRASVENHKPSFPVVEETRPVFHYDPNRPLTNKPPAKKEEE
jgi:hypothetical protein